MRKNLFQISALLATGIVAGSLSAAAQTERIVKLTTGKAVGSEITLLVNHTYEGVTVDWGDGNPVAYNTGRDAIREVTGTVKGSQITITGDDMWDMLSCAGCGLTAIDLEGAKGLKSLYVQNNELTTISLKGMEQLTDFNASNNALTTIEYTNPSYPENDLKSIENFNVSNNSLSGTFVIRTASLTSADISYNKYSTIYLSSNSKLDMLNCAGNALKSLPISSCKNITTLVCSDNALTSLTLPSGIATLQQLVADNNKIRSKMDLSASASLYDLSVANNAITQLVLPASTRLSTLAIEGNSLTFNSLPKSAQKPGYLSFMPQARHDISKYENVQTSADGVPYMPVVTWAERTSATSILNLNDLRYIGVTETSSGTPEAVINWIAVDAEGNETPLTKGTTSSAPNDYYYSNGKTAFFTPHGKVYARIQGNKLYPDYYVDTTPIAIGSDMVTGIGQAEVETGKTLTVVGMKGQLQMSSQDAATVNIVSIDGKQVWSGTVSGTVTINLPAGMYVAGGVKAIVK